MGVATTYMTPGLRLMFSRSALAFVVLSVMMTLYGCQSTSTSSDPKTRKSPATQDKPAKAKSKSVRSSATPETEARLDAAELWFEGGDPYLARLSMRDIDISNLTGSARARALLIHVQTDLALGLIDEAAAALADPGFSTGEKARLRADLCQRERQLACVANELIRAAEAEGGSSDYNNRIWDALLRTATGEGNLTGVGADGSLQGWLDLVDLVRRSPSLQAEREAFSKWRQRYPNHSAASQLPDAIDYLLTDDPATPMTVAVLLPLTGPLASIGRAVRDGLVAAHIQEISTSSPTLMFLDSAAQPIAQLHEQAVQSGVGMIVGPLVKNDVVALASRNPQLPVVALNYLDTTSPSGNFYQLGLAIEDEGLGIGDALNRFGHEKVLFITSTAPWASRSLSAIQQQWHGETSQTSISNAKDMTDIIGGALRATPSFRRKAELQSVLGMPVQFTGGVRRDLQAIVALTDPAQTSTLGPALSYHAVGTIPTFVGTQSVRNNGAIFSLQGARASELPVMLADDAMNQQLRSSFAGQGGADISFYALGADAYRLLRRLPSSDAPSSRTIWGATGLLTLNSSRQFRRTQLWSQIRNQRLIESPATP
jgi:uncharacterized protein